MKHILRAQRRTRQFIFFSNKLAYLKHDMHITTKQRSRSIHEHLDVKSRRSRMYDRIHLSGFAYYKK